MHFTIPFALYLLSWELQLLLFCFSVQHIRHSLQTEYIKWIFNSMFCLLFSIFNVVSWEFEHIYRATEREQRHMHISCVICNCNDCEHDFLSRMTWNRRRTTIIKNNNMSRVLKQPFKRLWTWAFFRLGSLAKEKRIKYRCSNNDNKKGHVPNV